MEWPARPFRARRFPRSFVRSSLDHSARILAPAGVSTKAGGDHIGDVLGVRAAGGGATSAGVADPERRRATYEDVLRAPRHLVAEVIGGELHLQPGPAQPHAAAASALGEELGPPFKRGRGGPGGWILLDAPELHLAADILVPDLAGWRRERLPVLTKAPHFTLAPDWACEVLSRTTAKADRAEKLPVYAREQIRHVWLVDPILRTLEVLELEGAHFRILAVHRDDDRVRAVPFDAIELDLSILWADVQIE